MGIVDDVAGVADNLAGSTDEAVGRQFDDEPGGGLIDGYQSYAAEVYDPVTDGAVSRQFDDEPGGGLVDGAQETATDAADAAVDIGPDWLGPAVIAVLGVVLIGALLFLSRPLLTIISEAVG
jgi:hypothetical protein